MKSQIANQYLDEQSIPVSSKRYKLSRFTLIRPGNEGLVLENPFTPEQLKLSGTLVIKILQAFIHGADPDELIEEAADQAKPLLKRVIDKCMSCGFLVEMTSEDESLEDDGALMSWEYHDLLFHARSRIGRHYNPVGGTYPFHGKLEAPPVVGNVSSPTVISLDKPDLNALKQKDLSFTEVLENRCSDRKNVARPFYLDQLGDFLYRSCRIKSIEEYDNGLSVGTRVYPGGGGLYPLEVYPLVSNVTGLNPGLYHYNAQDHNLALVNEPDEITERIVKDAMQAGGVDTAPAVLFLITARFQRMAWKYKSISYSLILKEVGCLYQTLYLVATAMNLSACALGSGNSDLCSKVIRSKLLS